MKATINMYGSLLVQATTETELYALKRWNEEYNKTNITSGNELLMILATVANKDE